MTSKDILSVLKEYHVPHDGSLITASELELVATHVSSKLLKLASGMMHFTNWMNLLYFVERESLVRWHHPVIGDDYCCTPCGFELTNISTWCVHSLYQRRYLRVTAGVVSLIRNPIYDYLPPADSEIIQEVWDQFGHMSSEHLSTLAHELPEYHSPKDGVREKLSLKDILINGIGVDTSHAEVLAAEADAHQKWRVMQTRCNNHEGG